MHEDKADPQRAPARDKPGFVRWTLRGAAVGVAIALAALFFTRRTESLPRLNAAALAAAEATWREHGPSDYALEVQVEGPQPATYVVNVVGGQPIAAARNGAALTQERTWDTWSVPGMFETLAEDVGRMERAPGELRVWCQFDPATGYPAQYRRVEYGQAIEVTWTVTKFAR